MAKLLEIREQLRSFYGKYDVYIRPALRFVVAIVLLFTINGSMGYMSRLSNPAISLVLAMICTFLPANATLVVSALLILAHLFSLSMEVAAVALLLILLMFFMYFKYAPKNGYSVLITPILCRFGISHPVPTVLGLTKAPYSAISMVCGLILYYFLHGIQENKALLGAAEETGGTSKLTVVLELLIENKEMYLVVASFILTTIVVYVIRRQSIDHAWTIAIAVGNALNFVILLSGSIAFDLTGKVPMIIVGTAVAVIVGILVEFFLFHLDYVRTERVQFEDDEYYYYVKAVPKVYVSGSKKQVKQINSRKENSINKRDFADEFEIDEELLDD